MDYKSLMGYGKKKKVIKEQSKPNKPKVNNVLKDIKQELNESNVALGIQTLKDNPPFQIKEVGAAPLYKKHIKSIDKYRDQVGREVLKFYELLRKKGLNDAAEALLDSYKKNVINFGKDLKQLVRKLM
jgi:hypothetical protein